MQAPTERYIAPKHARIYIVSARDEEEAIWDVDGGRIMTTTT